VPLPDSPIADASLPHQVVFGVHASKLNVSCNCLVRGGLPPLAEKTRFGDHEGLDIYAMHRRAVLIEALRAGRLALVP
jgi:hypothetical protein